MPTLSDHEALICAVLLATQEELDLYFANLEKDSDSDNKFEDNNSESSSSKLLSSTSSTSSTSSSSCSSEAQAGSDMDISDADKSSDQEQATRLTNVSYYNHILNQILASRLLEPCTSVPKSSQLYLVLVQYKAEKPKQFWCNLRVAPSTFDALVNRIQDHSVFKNQSNSQQFPVEIQLAIALYRFGHDGNAASVESIAQWAGVSVGMVVKATRRVMIAFLALHDTVVCWPSEEEKEEAREWVESTSCAAWRTGFCMVNGTLILLFEKPGHHGEAYFDRKSNYSMNIQLITLPNLRIIDYVVGYCGSTHDATVFKASCTYNHNYDLFDDDEWIWADSAYALDLWCVTPYKKPLSNLPKNARFNYYLCSVRVKSEHAVGYLKGCFCSLCGLRQQIDNPRDHERANTWIKTCIVIHTLISLIEHGHEDWDHIKRLIQRGSDNTPVNAQADIEAEAVRETRGQKK